ncbi:MAG: LTA synthase family protein [Bacteroidales bacterium]|nr:LTA synthase family protein [Bacteroidales bacterium]
MIKNKEVILWKLILIRLGIMLLLLSLSRWLLYLFNANYFEDLNFKELVKLYLIGFRFDIHTLIIFNIPFIIAYGIPLKIKYNRIYTKITDVIFIASNSIAIALNIIDVIYFRYLDKRMSSELFTFIKGSDENQGSLILSFISDFWFMFLIFFVFLFIIIILTTKTKLKESYFIKNSIWYVNQSLFFIIILGLSVLGIRGGFQLKPINLTTATNYTSAQNTPLILNTPFCICMSSTSSTLDKVEYFKDDEIASLYEPIHKNLNTNRFIKEKTQKSNIVLIILESFGQEMIGFYNKGWDESLTPFLDSLLKESLTFDGMANGRRSIEALPSIFCGLPSLMPTDYPSSRYAINRLEGFGNILKKNGYTTAFFHGGNNGTMSFNSTSKSSGFDKYYGRNEYNNDSDFDGAWGIYDDAFLQFTAQKLNEFPMPFAAVIFTLSSHHPYSLPDNYNLEDTIASTPFEATISYVDNALKDFFNTISKEKWFDNTIFIITADHVSPEHKFNNYKHTKGLHQVPIAFYAPKIIESEQVNEIAQHLDIGVSLLSALNINDTVFSFGRNLFDSIQKPSFISYSNNIYNFSDGEYFLQSDGKEIKKIFDLKTDSNLKNNIYKSNLKEWKELDKQFKLRVQQYNNRMINNKLYYKK